MEARRQIRGSDFIGDIRAGMAVLQLMQKYRISPGGLRRIFRKILEAEAMCKGEFAGRKNLYEGAAGLKYLRRTPRKLVNDPVWLYDGGDPFKEGRLLDVSDTGVCVEGIKTRMGELKSFIARIQPSGRNSSFVFEGRCRWVRKERQPTEKFVAGFEITSISPIEQKVFQKLLEKAGNN
ncbi:MAG: PilZ domain-containing protein [Deltaproteobacteria bacterium]